MKTIIFACALAITAAPAFAQSNHGHHSDHHMTETQAAIAGTGTVDAVKADTRQIKVTHEPIKALSWPAMTMDLAVAEDVDLSKLEAGDKIDFELARGDDNIYMIKSLTKK